MVQPKDGVKSRDRHAAHVSTSRASLLVLAKATDQAMDCVVDILNTSETQPHRLRIGAILVWNTFWVPLVVADLVEDLVRL